MDGQEVAAHAKSNATRDERSSILRKDSPAVELARASLKVISCTDTLIDF